MASTTFVDQVTKIPAEWANDVNDAVYNYQNLTNPVTLYVRTDGSDGNAGVANDASNAFLTIQKAVDTIKDSVKLQGTTATISVADGTYTGGVIIEGPINNGLILIQGNTTTPSNCNISVTSANCFLANKGAHVFVRGFKLNTTTSGSGLVAYLGSTISSQSMEFSGCVNNHIEAGSSGTIIMDGDYSVTGAAVGHWHVGSEGQITCGTITVTVTGSPAFSAYFVGVAEGSVSCQNVTFTSTSATGPFFLAHKNGVIDIGSNNISTFLPGNSAGTTNTGGVLATTDISWTPVVTFTTPGDLSVSYTTQTGTWSKVGDLVFVTCSIVTSAFTHATASGNLLISGLPWVSNALADVLSSGPATWQGITKAGYTQVSPYIVNGSTNISFLASGSAQAISNTVVADVPTGGSVTLRFSTIYRSATT